MKNESGHEAVLKREAVDALEIQSGSWYVDATFGRGGHTGEILKLGGNVIAFDIDREAIEYGEKQFANEIAAHQLVLVKANFEFLEAALATSASDMLGNIAGVLADFGVSSNQLSEVERGFSFSADAPLDMRMNDELSVTAADLVNGLGKKELFRLLTEFSQEQQARTIVDTILDYRKRKKIETTKELAEIIEKRVGRHGHLHPATKTFMALRMLVNDELGVIERMLPQAVEVLKVGGRLVTISFHEGEDRIVKHFMNELAQQGRGIMLTKKPIEPTQEEIDRNPRSRSAKLRILKKI